MLDLILIIMLIISLFKPDIFLFQYNWKGLFFIDKDFCDTRKNNGYPFVGMKDK